MKSRENDIFGLFFNYPTKHWHFTELAKRIGIAQSKLDKWLKRMVNEKIVLKAIERGKMPYYVGNYESPAYHHKKMIFALNQLYSSGFLNHLSALQNAKAVVIFGSFARGDWFENSDIDLFIYGSDDGLSISEYELKLHRDIHLFTCKTLRQLNVLWPGLQHNIIKGYLVKGDLSLLIETANAKTIDAKRSI